MECVLKSSSVWGSVYKARGIGLIRAMEKADLVQKYAYPFLDHGSEFSWRPRGSRGPAKESQTLIVAYPYKDAVDLCNYDAFTSAAQELDLRVVREDVVYRGHAAYRIVVADRDVDIEAAIAQLPANA